MKKNVRINWSIFLMVFFLIPLASQAAINPLAYLPVQDSGRLKPYDTFARESLELIYGKTKYEGKPAVEVVTSWMLVPDVWDTMPLIEVRHSGLREALQIDHQKIHHTPRELMSNARLPLVVQELRSKKDSGEKLNPYFQEVQRLENQLSLYQAIKMGMAMRLVPSPTADLWLGVADLTGESREIFAKMTTAFLHSISSQDNDTRATNEAELKQHVDSFITMARAQAPEKYANDTTIKMEVHYNKLHPFRWAWAAYLLAGVFLLVFILSQKPSFNLAATVLYSVGYFLHIYGMGLRVYLAGRPPVSNMYETVVWVAFGLMTFAFIFRRVLRQPVIVLAATAAAILCLILTDLAPTVLDESLHPLEPVLRSTFWLTTHVLIITISYAAFFLAFAMGDWLLFLYLKDEKKYQKLITEGVQGIYRCIQIGVVLLAAGIILGGVWADYSWGRFWGWDPKETWALIALLGYIALLHGRIVGLVRNFGMAAGAVVAFALVIMAWYGVNFVLGAGLHSYGFGAGGVEYVSAFVAAHLLYVTFVYTVIRNRS